MLEKVKALVLKILDIFNVDDETKAQVESFFQAIADFLAKD